jgi:hypothetical protein
MYAICSTRRDEDDFRKLAGRRRYNDYYYILQMERMHSGWTTVETAGGAKRLQEFTIRLTSISTSFFLNFCKNKESLSLFIDFVLAHEDLGATSNKLMADASQKSRCGRIISS